MKTPRIVVATLLAIGLLPLAASAEEVSSPEKLKPLCNSSMALKGSHVLVYFWATWCPDCREKLNHGSLENLQKQFPNINVVTVNADREEARGKQFCEAENIRLPVFRDENHELTKSLHLFAVPSWAVMDKGADGTWSVRKSASGSDVAAIQDAMKGAM